MTTARSKTLIFLLTLSLIFSSFVFLPIARAGDFCTASASPSSVMTNLGHEDVLNDCFKLGAKYYILKSEVTPNKVLSVIKEALKT